MSKHCVNMVASCCLLVSWPAFAGSVMLPNTFSAGTPARADEVNANFTAIKNAVDDNDARISALAGGTTQSYRYKNVVGTLTDSSTGAALNAFYLDMNATVSGLTVGGGAGTARPDMPVVKLVVADGPAVASLFSAAASGTPVPQLVFSMSGITLELTNYNVTGIAATGKEYALPSRYPASNSDPDLVSITLTALPRNAAAVAMSDDTGARVTYEFDPARGTGCAATRVVPYVQLNGDAVIPRGLWPVYRVELGLDTSASTTYVPAVVSSALSATNIEVCLFGDQMLGRKPNEVTVQRTDGSGRVLSGSALTLTDNMLAGYRLTTTESGDVVLSIAYAYVRATLRYDSSHISDWSAY